MKIALVIATCLAASLICLDAQPGPPSGDREGPRGGGHRGGPGGRPSGGHRGGPGGGDGHHRDGGFRGRKFNGTRYQWTRVVEQPNITANESAFVKNDTRVVFVSSRDRILRSVNITGAKTIYNFVNESNTFLVYIIERFLTPIFLVRNPGLEFNAVIETLNQRNNTRVETASEISLTASGTPLSEEELRDLTGLNTSFPLYDGRRPVLLAAPTDPTATPSANPTSQVTIYDLNSRVTIIYPTPTPVPGRSGPERVTRARKLGRGGRYSNRNATKA